VAVDELIERSERRLIGERELIGVGDEPD